MTSIIDQWIPGLVQFVQDHKILTFFIILGVIKKVITPLKTDKTQEVPASESVAPYSLNNDKDFIEIQSDIAQKIAQRTQQAKVNVLPLKKENILSKKKIAPLSDIFMNSRTQTANQGQTSTQPTIQKAVNTVKKNPLSQFANRPEMHKAFIYSLLIKKPKAFIPQSSRFLRAGTK